jgi:hypothetical protein
MFSQLQIIFFICFFSSYFALIGLREAKNEIQIGTFTKKAKKKEKNLACRAFIHDFKIGKTASCINILIRLTF